MTARYRVRWPIHDDTRTLAELTAEGRVDFPLVAAAHQVPVDLATLTFHTDEVGDRLFLVGEAAVVGDPRPCPYCQQPRGTRPVHCGSEACYRAHEQWRYHQRRAA